MFDVPQSRLADLAGDGVVSEPAAAGRVLADGPLGGERDAVLLEVPAGARILDAKPEHWHCPDVPADRQLDRCFLVGPVWVGAVAVEPGCEQSGRLRVALDERPQTCRRKIEARWLPLPGSRPARCPRCCRSRSHKVALLVAVSACVPTRTTLLLPSLRTSPSSKKK